MKKLLIVEDDLLLDEAYRRKFEGKYELRTAMDGETGIRVAKEWLPDAMILDIYMPGKFNGLDVLEEVKKDKDMAEMPVIVIINLPDAMERVKSLGGTKCFMKTDVDLNQIDKELDAVLM